MIRIDIEETLATIRKQYEEHAASGSATVENRIYTKEYIDASIANMRWAMTIANSRQPMHVGALMEAAAALTTNAVGNLIYNSDHKLVSAETLAALFVHAVEEQMQFTAIRRDGEAPTDGSKLEHFDLTLKDVGDA